MMPFLPKFDVLSSNSFVLSKKVFHAIPSIFKFDEKELSQNVKLCDEAQILKDWAVFGDKFSTYEKMNPVTP